MRNDQDIGLAKLAVARQLARPDIGASHQRAMLQGMLVALAWAEGHGEGKALQKLVDGHEIQVNDQAHIGGPAIDKKRARVLTR